MEEENDEFINISDMSIGEKNEELLESARYGEDELLQMLLSSGADANYVDESGSTAIHKAAANGQIQCLQILINAGALHKSNGQGNYPIHWAAQNGQNIALKLLLDSFPDADVLAQNGNGISTLTEAFNSNKQEVLEICLAHSSASDEKLMAPIKGKTVVEEEDDENDEMDIEKHAVIHKMNLSLNNDQSNNDYIMIRELPITRADNPFGSDDSPEDDSTGLAVWPASIILARWTVFKKELIKDKTRLMHKFAAVHKDNICIKMDIQIYEEIIDLLLKLLLLQEPSEHYKIQVGIIRDMIKNSNNM